MADAMENLNSESEREREQTWCHDLGREFCTRARGELIAYHLWILSWTVSSLFCVTASITRKLILRTCQFWVWSENNSILTMC